MDVDPAIWTSPFAQREIECSITQDRLQLYIRPHRPECWVRATMENRPFAPHSLIGPDRCRQVSLGLQTSV